MAPAIRAVHSPVIRLGAGPGANATYIGAAGGDYRNAANWSGGVVPDNTQGGSFDVFITANAPIISGAPVTIDNLSVTATGTRLDSTSLTVNGASDVHDFAVAASSADATARFGVLGGTGAASPAFGGAGISLALSATLGRTATAQWTGANLVSNSGSLTFSGPGVTRIIDENNLSGLRNFAVNNNKATLTVADGNTFATAGAFTNNGALRVLASPGTANTAFTISGTLTNLVNGTLTAPIVTGGVTFTAQPASYEIRAAPGLTSTLRITGANVTTLGAANNGDTPAYEQLSLTLAGAGSRFVDENGQDALRNLAAIGSAQATLEFADGRNFTTAGDFRSEGRLIVSAAPGTSSTFTVGGHLANVRDGGASLGAGTQLLQAGTNINLAVTAPIFAVEAPAGGTATMVIPGLNAILLNQVKVVLDGPGSAILNEKGQDALRGLKYITGGSTPNLGGPAPPELQISNGRTFTTQGDLSVGSNDGKALNAGLLTVDSSVAGAASRLTITGTLSEFNPADGSVSGGNFRVVARDGGSATLQWTGADVQALNMAGKLVLSGTDAHIVDQNGQDALRNLSSIGANTTLTLAEGHNFTTAGSLTNNGTTYVDSAGPLVGFRDSTNLPGTNKARHDVLASQFSKVVATTVLTTTGDLTNNSHIEVSSYNGGTAALTVNGTFTNAGTLFFRALDDGGHAVVTINGALANFDSATRNLTGSFSFFDNSPHGADARLQFAGADVVTNNASLAFRAVIGNRSVADFVTDLSGQSAFRHLAVNGPNGNIGLNGVGIDGVNSFTNQGFLTIGIDPNVPAIDLNTGFVVNNYSGSQVNLGTGSTFTNSGTVFVNSGRIIADNVTQIDGTTYLGQTLQARSLFSQTGGKTVLNAPFTSKLIAPLSDFSGGQLTGSGTIQGNVVFRTGARLAPSFPFQTTLAIDPGTITVNGNLAFQSGGIYDVTLDGTARSRYDLLDVKGTLTLAGGLLTATLDSGFLPTNSDAFTIATADNPVLGAFGNVADGGRLEVADNSGSFLVRYGSGAYLDSVVLLDFRAGVVPEPDAWVLLLLGGASLLGVAVHRRRSPLGWSSALGLGVIAGVVRRHAKPQAYSGIQGS